MPTFYIVRHGQSQANAGQIMQGARINTGLTDLGCSQAEQTADKLAGIKFNKVYVSPLLRAAQTAQIIRPRQTVTFDWNLREFDYGQWDGQLTWKLWRDYPAYFDESHNLLPGSQKYSRGESHEQAFARLENFFTEVINDLADDAQVLVVSHGYTIKLIVALVLGSSNVAALNEPDNAGVTKIEWSTGRRTLLYYNK